ncbi:hypothetical protein GCM10011415_05790 [Salipiger pallidus]|uniref:Tat pathway signal sequence domain protein n=1 Tax=Salipiger pallidus TaxID=1775170 RepID=A0A8J2ZH69_9RHOB|nr:hypothetical protein [Salipiger pallidus]GGG62363.1 hypothetical protein GCM10011415_05790 [Salipiger pallidus]
MTRAFRLPLLTFPSVFLALAAPAIAQDAPDAPALSIELNAQEQQENGCKLSFLARNNTGDAISAAVFETVLFDDAGQVDRLTLFDFGALPANKPRLRQFVVPGLQCDALGQVLINGAATCEAEAGAATCTEGLSLSSRTDVEMMG